MWKWMSCKRISYTWITFTWKRCKGKWWVNRIRIHFIVHEVCKWTPPSLLGCPEPVFTLARSRAAISVETGHQCVNEQHCPIFLTAFKADPICQPGPRIKVPSNIFTGESLDQYVRGETGGVNLYNLVKCVFLILFEYWGSLRANQMRPSTKMNKNRDEQKWLATLPTV